MQQPAATGKRALHGIPCGQSEQREHEEAQSNHDAEGPEQRRNARDRIVHCLVDHFRRRCRNVRCVLFQQQAKAEIVLAFVEPGLDVGVRRVFAQRFQQLDGLDAVDDPLTVLFLDLDDAGNLLADAARADQSHDPRQLDLEIVLHLGLVGDGDQVESGGGGFGFPHRLHRGELGLLRLADRIARLVAEHDDRGDRGDAEGGGDAETALGEFDIASAQQIPGRNREHEHGAGDIARRNRVYELGLRVRIEDDRPEVGHLHAHGDVVELGADRVLHPAVGDQDPQRR